MRLSYLSQLLLIWHFPKLKSLVRERSLKTQMVWTRGVNCEIWTRLHLLIHSIVNLQMAAAWYVSVNNLGRASGKVKTFSKSLRQGIRKLLNWWKVQTLRKVLLLFNTYAGKEFWYFFAKSTGLTNSNWEKLDWVDRFVWEALLFNTYAGKKCLYLWAKNTGWSYSLLWETLTCWSWFQTHVVASKGAVLF